MFLCSIQYQLTASGNTMKFAVWNLKLNIFCYKTVFFSQLIVSLLPLIIFLCLIQLFN